jgi:hypothetical protein
MPAHRPNQMKKHQRDEETLKLPGAESPALIPNPFSPNTQEVAGEALPPSFCSAVPANSEMNEL